MPQAFTAVLAVGAVFGAPVAAGLAMQPDKPALPPHDEEISVQAEGDEDVDVGFRVLIEASGRPQRRTTLRNGDGLETARVLRHSSCEGVRARSIGYDGRAPEDWCLNVESLPAHEHVSGVVKGTALVETEPAIRLALTVDHRDEFFPWPAVAMAGGLLLGLVGGVGFSLVAPKITRLRLRRKVAKNERAASTDRINGLRERVDALLEGGHDEGQLLAAVKWIVKSGPKTARNARGKLQSATSNGPLPPWLAEQAQTEGGRTDHAADDFLDYIGNRVEHPAERLAQALLVMAAYRKQLDRFGSEIAKLPSPGKANEELSEARVAWDRVDELGDVARISERVEAVENAIIEAQGADARRAQEAASAPPAAVGSARGGRADVAARLRPASWSLRDRIDASEVALFLLWGITVALVILALAVAVAALYKESYEAAKTFGEKWDYLALLGAAFVAGGAGTYAAFLNPWSPTS